MTRHQDIATLQRKGQASAILSLKERFDIVIAAYAAHADTAYTMPKNLEDRDLSRARATSSAGNSLEVAVNALNAAGHAIPPNMGGVMDALQLSQRQMDDLFCFCHGDNIYGDTIVMLLKRRAPKS